MNPYDELEVKDCNHKFLCLCSYISLCENKKLNLATVLMNALSNNSYKWLFLNVLALDTEYEIVKVFLRYDPLLYKSKYLTKFFKNNDILK